MQQHGGVIETNNHICKRIDMGIPKSRSYHKHVSNGLFVILFDALKTDQFETVQFLKWNIWAFKLLEICQVGRNK